MKIKESETREQKPMNTENENFWNWIENEIEKEFGEKAEIQRSKQEMFATFFQIKNMVNENIVGVAGELIRIKMKHLVDTYDNDFKTYLTLHKITHHFEIILRTTDQFESDHKKFKAEFVESENDENFGKFELVAISKLIHYLNVIGENAKILSELANE